MCEAAKSMSHTVSPHSKVECAIAPNESSVTMSFIVFILTLMDVATREYSPSKALNTIVIVQLADQIFAVFTFTEF